MAKKIWVVEGIGAENPRPVTVSSEETVGDFRMRQAKELDMSPSEIQLATDRKKLVNDNANLLKEIGAMDTVNILPRAKGG